MKRNMDVAVAVICDEKKRLLITKRAMGTAHGGLWEFPGGKVEADEHPQAALVREILEEVGLEIEESIALGRVQHHYNDISVVLHVYFTRRYKGHAYCKEKQIDLQWIRLDEINHYEFPEANHSIIQLVKNHL